MPNEMILLYVSDVGTFEDLYRVEFPGLVAVATALTGDFAANEDLVQDTMVKAFGVAASGPPRHIRGTRTPDKGPALLWVSRTVPCSIGAVSGSSTSCNAETARSSPSTRSTSVRHDIGSHKGLGQNPLVERPTRCGSVSVNADIRPIRCPCLHIRTEAGLRSAVDAGDHGFEVGAFGEADRVVEGVAGEGDLVEFVAAAGGDADDGVVEAVGGDAAGA